MCCHEAAASTQRRADGGGMACGLPHSWQSERALSRLIYRWRQPRHPCSWPGSSAGSPNACCTGGARPGIRTAIEGSSRDSMRCVSPGSPCLQAHKRRRRGHRAIVGAQLDMQGFVCRAPIQLPAQHAYTLRSNSSNIDNHMTHLPARPRSWSSLRLLSGSEAMMTQRPPASRTCEQGFRGSGTAGLH